MKKNFVNLLILLCTASAMSMACGDDDDSSSSTGGTSGSAGKAGSAGKGGSAGSAGTTSGSSGKGGSSAGTSGSSGSSTVAGSANGGQAGSGVQNGGAAGSGVENGGAAGAVGGGAAGDAGAGGASAAEMLARGTLIVRNMALCGGCHTAAAGMELGGNPLFKGGALPAPNLTPDATGLGDWTDQQIMNAFRNGIDDQGRHLDPAMPYWLFHNMSDDDAMAVVTFLRSLPASSGAVGDANPDATPVTPLAPAGFPDSSLQAADADYAAAQQGKYLVSGVFQCVKCHSPSSAGLPAASYFSGVVPANNTTIFAPNITPDATGLSGWTATDIATALKAGTNKAAVTLCGSMPSAAKGYGSITDDDAHAIGVYMTTIPAVANANASPTLEPACP